MPDFSWNKILATLKDNVGERLFSTWLEPTSFEGVEDSPQGKILKIGVPGPMYKESINSNFLPELETAIASQIPSPFQIEIVIVNSPVAANSINDELLFDPAPQTSTTSNRRVDGSDPRLKRDFLNPEYTFGSFVVGQGNQVAHAACHSVSENPGKAANPLFVYGPSGLGKTHLLNAIGNEVRAHRPHLRICYVSGERFLNDFVGSIRHGQMEKFRKRYREQCDLLIIDDIHILANKDAVQEEFFYTFNTFHEMNKQVVVSSDKYPRDIDGLEERIRTRLEWGLTVDIQPPDIETRMAILRYKAEGHGLALPDNVIYLIAQISRKSVRELEGHLATLRMYSELQSSPITYEFAQAVFSKFLDTQKKGLCVEDIQRMVCEKFSVSIKDLKSATRVKTIVIPRQVAMYLCRNVLDLGVAEIGRAFGGRDHTTVLHSLTKVKESLLINEDFARDVAMLEKRINNSEWISA